MTIPKELVVKRVDPVLKLFERVVGNGGRALQRARHVESRREVKVARLQKLLHGVDLAQQSLVGCCVERKRIALLKRQQRYLAHHEDLVTKRFAGELAILDGYKKCT